MKIKRGNRFEDIDPRGFHNLLTATIDGTLTRAKLPFKRHQVAAPKPKRTIWKNDPKRFVGLTILDIKEVKTDGVEFMQVNFEVFYPNEEAPHSIERAFANFSQIQKDVTKITKPILTFFGSSK